MPYSAHEGKSWVIETLRASPPPPVSILDVGSGGGSWLDALRPWFPGARYTAVEIYEPYLGKFDLRDRYHEVVVADIRDIEIPRNDVIILGDVLEHMPEADAIDVWDRSLLACRLLFASIPLGEYPQGPSHGNAHEEHVATWDDRSIMRAFKGIGPRFIGDVVGVYSARGAWC